ncbi:MAG TPA: hypothetical protein VFW73_05920, partial [Lacipirellulaceae bacterium]|nr:hypothetical protein [Lacipirellulaceae bacterium]
EYDLMLRLGEVARLANLDRVLLHYRMHQSSMNGSAMRRMRTSVLYACESARRRQNGLPPISFEDFQAIRNARPPWQRLAESIDIHARNQYRVALAEFYGGRRVRGAARLAWSAACAPKLTFERLIRIFTNDSTSTRNSVSRDAQAAGAERGDPVTASFTNTVNSQVEEISGRIQGAIG